MRQAWEKPVTLVDLLGNFDGNRLLAVSYITVEERDYLNEVYDYNPLLFDFVLKRAIKVPGTERRLPASVFMSNSGLGV